MSYQLVDKVFETDGLTRIERLVLMVLARHAHNDGTEARPCVRTMMRGSASSHGSVVNALRSLERKKYIEDAHPERQKRGGRKNGNGQYLTVVYTLLTDNWKPFSVEAEITEGIPPQIGGLESARLQTVAASLQSTVINPPNCEVNPPQIGAESVLNQSKNLSINPSNEIEQDGRMDFSDSMKNPFESSQNEQLTKSTPEALASREKQLDDLRIVFAKETGHSLFHRARKSQRQWLIGQIDAMSCETVKKIIKSFADAGHDWNRVQCPLAILEREWDDHAAIVKANEETLQEIERALRYAEAASRRRREEILKEYEESMREQREMESWDPNDLSHFGSLSSDVSEAVEAGSSDGAGEGELCASVGC